MNSNLEQRTDKLGSEIDLFKQIKTTAIKTGKLRTEYIQEADEQYLNKRHFEIDKNDVHIDYFTEHFFNEGTEHLVIFKGKDKVFDVIHPQNNKEKIETYKPGVWETQLNNYLH